MHLHLIDHLSGQFMDAADRIAQDVMAAKEADIPVGFVLYALRNGQGEPLKQGQAEQEGVTLTAMVQTPGFSDLLDKADKLDVKVRIDLHLQTVKPQPIRIYRLMVDGW